MRASNLSSIISHLSSFHCALSVVLCALLCLLLAACSRSPRAELRMADDVMEADPDSAMALLSAIDRSTLADGELPLYALLFTQAQVKQNVRLTSDSLIAVALEAYRFDAPNPSLRMRAHFYDAQVAYYRGDMPAAMRTAIVAYELSRRLDDPYWTAKAAELIADIFDEVYNYPQSKKFRREAADNYNKAGKIRNHRFALCDLALCKINMGKCEEAQSILDSLRSVLACEQPFDSILDNYAVYATLPILRDTQQYEELDRLSDTYRSNSSFNENFSEALLQSYVAASRGNVNESSSALLSAYRMSEDDIVRIRAIYADYQTSFTLGRFERAATLADSLLALQSELAESILSESVTSIQRDFYSHQSAEERQKSQRLKTTIIFVIIIAILSLIIIGVLFRNKMQRKRAELEVNLSSLMLLRKQYDKDQDIKAKLFKSQWSTLNDLCYEYFEHGPTQQAQKEIFKKIESTLKEMRKPQNILIIQNTIDDYSGGKISLLRAECPFLNEDDIWFISMLYVDLSNRTICLLTDMKIGYFYERRRRLKQRVENSDAPHKDIFIEMIGPHKKAQA